MLKLSMFLSLSDEVLPVTKCDMRGVPPVRPTLYECVRLSEGLTRYELLSSGGATLYERNLRLAELQRLGLED